MSFLRAILRWAVVGAAIPVAARTAWPVIDAAVGDRDLEVLLLNALLMLCPPWIFMLPGDDTPELARGLFVVAASANVALYAVVGGLVWLGVRRHAVFLGAAVVGVAARWWKVLSL